LIYKEPREKSRITGLHLGAIKIAQTIYETNNLQAIEYSGVFVMAEEVTITNS
jgi:hypothetical protein